MGTINNFDKYNFDEFLENENLSNDYSSENSTSASESQTNEEGFRIRTGESSSIEISEPQYDYDRNTNVVTYSWKEIINNSPWGTGELKIICWMTSTRLSADNWFDKMNEDYVLVGEVRLGFLEEGYKFNSGEVKFNMPAYDDIKDCEWYFAFTINELSPDDQWLIIDHKTSDLERFDNT